MQWAIWGDPIKNVAYYDPIYKNGKGESVNPVAIHTLAKQTFAINGYLDIL